MVSNRAPRHLRPTFELLSDEGSHNISPIQKINHLRCPHLAERYQSARKVQVLRTVVFRDVLLHLRRLLRAVPTREIAADAVWQNSARPRDTGCSPGYGLGHGCPEPHGLSLTRSPGIGESLAEYRSRCRVHRDHGSGCPWKLALLCVLWTDRDRPHSRNRLVCLDLAERIRLFGIKCQSSPVAT